MEKGMGKGKYENALETGRKMKKNGFDTGTIVEMTGLTAEEVEKL